MEDGKAKRCAVGDKFTHVQPFRPSVFTHRSDRSKDGTNHFPGFVTFSSHFPVPMRYKDAKKRSYFSLNSQTLHGYGRSGLLLIHG